VLLDGGQDTLWMEQQTADRRHSVVGIAASSVCRLSVGPQTQALNTLECLFAFVYSDAQSPPIGKNCEKHIEGEREEGPETEQPQFEHLVVPEL